MGSSSTRSSRNASGKLKGSALSQEFYQRDTIQVAQELLGKVLVVRDSRTGEPTAGRIVETEAYHGEDPACHASRGETPRCAIMFGQPGIAYVYLIYGMYEMLNFVTEPQGYPGAVLIRALEPLFGEEQMRKRRKLKGTPKSRELANGPGKLCRALGIRLKHNGASLQGPEILVLDDGFGVSRSEILASPRVGISQAVDAMWRFYLQGNDHISRVKENLRAKPVAELGELRYAAFGP